MTNIREINSSVCERLKTKGIRSGSVNTLSGGYNGVLNHST
ncbi:hypothetical protein [Zhongshania sp. BJYM1]|nr:hypothetical protein [Marortus sp. BJYM1]